MVYVALKYYSSNYIITAEAFYWEFEGTISEKQDHWFNGEMIRRLLQSVGEGKRMWLEGSLVY